MRTIYFLEDTARFATPLTNEDLFEDALDTASRKEIKKRRKTLYLSHRKILCDWLVDVQHEYVLSDETRQSLFLLLDRCLQVMSDLSRPDPAPGSLYANREIKEKNELEGQIPRFRILLEETSLVCGRADLGGWPGGAVRRRRRRA